MISFDIIEEKVVLRYTTDLGNVSWIDKKLQNDGKAKLAHAFTVKSVDLLPFLDDDDSGDMRSFAIGTVEEEYYVIRADVLELKYDLRISQDIDLTRRLFVAERNISIFRKVDGLAEEPIIIGGTDVKAIPEQEFRRLLREFPNSRSLDHYAASRVSHILREYLGTMTDAERSLATFMARRDRRSAKQSSDSGARVPVASELELEKFTYVRDQLVEMLKDAESFHETEWQKSVAELFLLIYPQYVTVLSNVQILDMYSTPGKKVRRYIDMLLVAASGDVDVIEIKKPSDHLLISKAKYRDNHIPRRDLTGAIVQAEKYVFYLGKLGPDGEEELTKKYAAELPDGLKIRIRRPKVIILSGRDSNLGTMERHDFEFSRHMFASVADIVSYDDLIRRLDNVIGAVGKRSRGEKA